MIKEKEFWELMLEGPYINGDGIDDEYDDEDKDE